MGLYKTGFAALAMGFLWLIPQQAAALDCPKDDGDDLAIRYVNATDQTCYKGNTIDRRGDDGHVLTAGIFEPTGNRFYVELKVFYDGILSAASSPVLSCTSFGGPQRNVTISIVESVGTVRANFSAGTRTASCDISYTDQNGETVSHGYEAASVYILENDDFEAQTGRYSVDNGWFANSPPTVVLSGLSAVMSGTEIITAQFSEEVTDFTVGDLSVSNLTVSNFTAVDGDTYNFDVTPILDGAVSVSLPAATVVDLDGADNEASNTLIGSADITGPTTVISGAPASISGAEDFTVNISFSETVTGLSAADISITGGSVSNLSGSGSDYTASISATGASDVLISVPAGVAQDTNGNDNAASGVVTVTLQASTVVVSQAPAAIAKFMFSRANALIASQPDLTALLRGDSTGRLDINVDGTSMGSKGDFAFDSGSDYPVWTRLNANWSQSDGVQSAYVLGVLGVHKQVSENLLIGGMVQLDYSEELNGANALSGTGWLVGPYLVAKSPSHPLYFNASLLYGQTYNSISPAGASYTDSFQTERWLATMGVSGEVEMDDVTLFPFLDASYTSDTQAAYIDGSSAEIAMQSITLAQLEVGLDFELLLTTDGSTMLTGGVSGIWAETSSSTGVIPAFEGGRARVELGVTHQIAAGNTLSVNTFYDGIGIADYESYGVDLIWQAEF